MIILLILYLILNFLILKYNLHIYQLNYYMFDTQLKYIINNKFKFLIIFFLNLIAIFLLNYNNLYINVIIGLIFFLEIILIFEKKVVIKIVFTSRIKRLYITNYLILLLVYFFSKDYFGQIYLIFIAFGPFYVFILDLINKPINQIINNYYINDAKKIINQMKDLKIIAITGSYGKTSMKNYITKLLSSKYNVLSTPGNFNTLLGITRTIREYLKPTHEIFVCEIGIDRVGQMDKIIELIHPDYAVITAIGEQHLATFKTLNNIKNSKLTLLKGLKKDGIVFLNYNNDELLNVSLPNNSIIGYGTNKNNLISLKTINYNEKGMNFSLKINEEVHDFESKLLGEHNLVNLIGAITVAHNLGIPINQIKYTVKSIPSVKHRLNLIKKDGFNILDDSYNSNPVGAKSAFNTLKMFNGLRIIITPGMVDLGSKEEELNYELGVFASKCSDYIILVGKKQTESYYKGLIDSKYDSKKIFVASDFTEAMNLARKIPANNQEKYILLENDLPDNYKK